MAKKYKIKKENLTEFFGLFSKKPVPDKLKTAIDNDPELKKIHNKISALQRDSGPYIEKLKKEDPVLYKKFQDIGWAP